ncbi:kinase-like domain-containing protein [Xylaria bambusicola]|uniref:kinase-like domain-containing protein n=1 Tax=Xylaria bambusicola TaxID=326684 RepID=UPI002008864F|nr:kinase-like domain-containing protein [Xylaria bambusicola]KAI0515146.1 kinase-like domain-containing protein [Xylaria bambusicola]
MAADADVPESVRDSRWEADFEPNPHVPYQTTNTLLSGRRLLKQEIWTRQKRLGHGGFGVVWLERAHSANQSSTRLRAVKELRVGREDLRRRDCIRELQVLVKFSQQKFVGSFVEFYNWYESNDALFIAMEYCQYGDLRQFVKENGAIIEADVRKITDQVLQGLMLMHENNFAHRDLKPANILIQHRPPKNEWKIKVADMGLSKQIDVEAASTTVRGTPGFIAPERIPGIGSATSTTNPFPCDMWCLGEVVFFLLTSERTFDSSIELQEYYNGKKSFPEERLKAAKIGLQAVDFIKALMAAQPSERLSAFQADYHSWMRDTGSMTRPQSRVFGRLQDSSHSSASQFNDPALGKTHKELADPPLGKLTVRGIVVSNSPRHTIDRQSIPSGSWNTSAVHLPTRSRDNCVPEPTDPRQETMTVPSGTWNSSPTYHIPESRNDESTIATSTEHNFQMRSLTSEDEEESEAETRGSDNMTSCFLVDPKGTIWPPPHIREEESEKEVSDEAEAYYVVDRIFLGPVVRQRKYMEMLEYVVQYIYHAGGAVPEYHTKSIERLYSDPASSLPGEDDAEDKSVFLSNDEKLDPDRSYYLTKNGLRPLWSKKPTQDHADRGSDIDVDGGYNSRSPCNARLHTSKSEEGSEEEI